MMAVLDHREACRISHEKDLESMKTIRTPSSSLVTVVIHACWLSWEYAGRFTRATWLDDRNGKCIVMGGKRVQLSTSSKTVASMPPPPHHVPSPPRRLLAKHQQRLRGLEVLRAVARLVLPLPVNIVSLCLERMYSGDRSARVVRLTLSSPSSGGDGTPAPSSSPRGTGRCRRTGSRPPSSPRGDRSVLANSG